MRVLQYNQFHAVYYRLLQFLLPPAVTHSCTGLVMTAEMYVGVVMAVDSWLQSLQFKAAS